MWLVALCAIFEACSRRPATLNGSYTANFYWNGDLTDVGVTRVYGDTLTPKAVQTIRGELRGTIKDVVAKANVQTAKGTVAFTVSGEPPYVVLVKGIDIREPSISGLVAAVEREDIVTIASLVSQYKNINQKELPSQRTALHNACAGSKVKSVDKLLVLGADPNSSDFEGDTPLIVAVTADSVAVARSLIAAGARVNQANQVGATPLINAAELDRTDMIKLLLQSGADQSLTTQDGKTALMIAEARHNAQAVAILRQRPRS